MCPPLHLTLPKISQKSPRSATEKNVFPASFFFRLARKIFRHAGRKKK